MSALCNRSTYILTVFQIPKEKICFLRRNYLATYFYQMQAKRCLDSFHHTFMHMLGEIPHLYLTPRWPSLKLWVLRGVPCSLVISAGTQLTVHTQTVPFQELSRGEVFKVCQQEQPLDKAQNIFKNFVFQRYSTAINSHSNFSHHGSRLSKYKLDCCFSLLRSFNWISSGEQETAFSFVRVPWDVAFQ